MDATATKPPVTGSNVGPAGEHAGEPVMPSAPAVGNVKKEYEPAPSQEYVQPAGAEVEPVIAEEVAGHVETVPSTEAPPLSGSEKQMGVHVASEATRAQTSPSGLVQLPKKEEVEKEIKATSPTDSNRGLLLLILKEIKKRLGM